jgi:hypothetical protein
MMSSYSSDPQVNATAAALDMTNAAMRDPVADEIPRDERGSFVERLEQIKKIADCVETGVKVCASFKPGDVICGNDATNIAVVHELSIMVAEKLKGVIRDMALAEGKGKSP